MAVTHSTAVRSAIADLIDDQINAGSADASGDFLIRESTTTLATIVLQNPAFGAASSGVITLAGVPLSVAASAAGTADNFQFRNRDNTVCVSGSITASGGGGDATLDNTNIANGQIVQINSLTYAAPN